MADASVHRPIHKGDHGPDVKRLQQGENRVVDGWDFDWLRQDVDPVAGHKTFDRGHFAGWLIGLSNDQLAKIEHGTLTQRAQTFIRGDKPRTHEMKMATERRRDRIAELRRQHNEGGLAGVQVVINLGPDHWGGGNDVMRQFVTPFLAKFGLSEGSGKRTPAENDAVGGSRTSDHLTTHLSTMARDYPTFDGEAAARALAAALGFSGWQPNSFASFFVKIDGHTFRVQILWGAAIGHDDHVHVGIGLVS